MFHVSAEKTTLPGIVEAVRDRYVLEPHVVQVVAVPLFASFPTYDFFLLHKKAKGQWLVAAGYQCKQGTESPSEDAWKQVALSVWIEGKYRNYSVRQGSRVTATLHLGWHLLGESTQADFLGVSVLEALPLDSVEAVNSNCPAEAARLEQKEAGATERAAKHACTSAP